MSDLYSETLVKKEQTSKDKAIKYGLIALTVIAVLAGLFVTALCLILAIVLAIVCYFVIPKTDLEYEYLFVNGEFDIDVVMAKSKRKKVMTIDMTDVDLMAPVNSHRMDYYNGNTRLKRCDYSSGNADHKRYALIAKNGGENKMIIVEPDEEMAQAIRKSSPSKVFLA